MTFVKGNKDGRNGGRKGYLEEIVVRNVLRMSWERIEKNLAGKRLTEKEKDLIAMKLVEKSVPQEISFNEDYEDKEKIDRRIAEITEIIRKCREVGNGIEPVKNEKIGDNG